MKVEKVPVRRMKKMMFPAMEESWRQNWRLLLALIGRKHRTSVAFPSECVQEVVLVFDSVFAERRERVVGRGEMKVPHTCSGAE